MSTAWTGDDHIRPAREEIDLKLVVRRDGIEADFARNDGCVGEDWDVVSQERPDSLLVVLSDTTIVDIGIDVGTAMPRRPSQPDPESPACRKTNRRRCALENEHREPANAERQSLIRPQIKHLLSRWA